MPCFKAAQPSIASLLTLVIPTASPPINVESNGHKGRNVTLGHTNTLLPDDARKDEHGSASAGMSVPNNSAEQWACQCDSSEKHFSVKIALTSRMDSITFIYPYRVLAIFLPYVGSPAGSLLWP